MNNNQNNYYYDSLPWVEKYRPKTLNDMIGHDLIIKTLSKFIVKSELPHLLFFGPAGIGKTSLIHACIRNIYKEGTNKLMFLELNASDDRGIDIVRKNIKEFSSTKSPTGEIRIVILDEADSMTTDAQAALRRIIEIYTHNIRFCLICNYVTRYSI